MLMVRRAEENEILLYCTSSYKGLKIAHYSRFNVHSSEDKEWLRNLLFLAYTISKSKRETFFFFLNFALVQNNYCLHVQFHVLNDLIYDFKLFFILLGPKKRLSILIVRWGFFFLFRRKIYLILLQRKKVNVLMCSSSS